MEAPVVGEKFGNEDKALKSLLDTFGSAFSLEEIASAFFKADRNANLAGDILTGKKARSPSTDATHPSFKAKIENSYGKLCYSNRNGSKAPNLKRNPASVGAISGVDGKEYVWRIAGSSQTLNDTQPLKVEAAPVASNSSVHGNKFVWRVAGSKSNGTPNQTRSLKVEANDFSVSVNSSEKPLHSGHATSGSSERSSSASAVSVNDDIENFLFTLLGHGCQLERSTVREVLGRCGYDMKKSLETLLDLKAVTLDRRNSLCEGNNRHPNSESSSVKQVQKQKYCESNGSRTVRTNLIPSRHSNERNRQQKEGLTTLLHAPEQSHLTLSNPVLESDMRFRESWTPVTEPLNGIAEDFKAKTAGSPQFVNMEDVDDAEEGSYYALRKAVKEHRDTMKGYYKAASEAFSRGEHDRALLLLEKGQFFYNKAREADEESSTKIFETSDSSMDSKTQEELSLDLQELDAKEAIRLVKIHLRTLSGIPFVRDLKLNIGSGDRDAEKRKRVIIKLLEKEAIQWIEDENSSAILIHLDEINPKNLSFFGRK